MVELGKERKGEQGKRYLDKWNNYGDWEKSGDKGPHGSTRVSPNKTFNNIGKDA